MIIRIFCRRWGWYNICIRHFDTEFVNISTSCCSDKRDSGCRFGTCHYLVKMPIKALSRACMGCCRELLRAYMGLLQGARLSPCLATAWRGTVIGRGYILWNKGLKTLVAFHWCATYICINVHLYIYIHIYICIYARTHMYIYTYIYISYIEVSYRVSLVEKSPIECRLLRSLL